MTGILLSKPEVKFRFDLLGRRIEKRLVRWHDEDGDWEPDPDEEGPPRVTRYLYDQEDILATFTDSGRELARYTHGPGIDEPLAEVRRHRTRFYHADTLGSIIALSNKHGHPVRSYRYSAFGVPEDHRGDPQPYRFTGREWDKEVYYYRTRYYAPSLGAFTQADKLSLGSLLRLRGTAQRPPVASFSYGLLLQTPLAQAEYRYMGNRPLYGADPSGNFNPLTIVAGAAGGFVGGAVAGGLVSGLSTLTTNLIEGKPLSEAIQASAQSVAVGAAAGALVGTAVGALAGGGFAIGALAGHAANIGLPNSAANLAGTLAGAAASILGPPVTPAEGAKKACQ